MDYINCPFCDEELQQPTIKIVSCCEKQDMINNKGTNVCRNCGTVSGHDTASEYVDFHENKNKIVKKSVYQRKYHLDNVLNDITSKNGWQLSVHNKNRIHDIFQKIDKILPQINGDRKRMININFIPKKKFSKTWIYRLIIYQ